MFIALTIYRTDKYDNIEVEAWKICDDYEVAKKVAFEHGFRGFEERERKHLEEMTRLYGTVAVEAGEYAYNGTYVNKVAEIKE